MDYIRRVTDWQRMIAIAPSELRHEMFGRACLDFAGLVLDGMDRSSAADELAHIAEAHELPPEWAQETVSHAFEHIPNKANGHAKAQATESLGEWNVGDDPGPIPPRQWLLGNQFCRGFLSSLVSAGGKGKSSLRLLQYISLATGREISGQHVFKRCRVLLISLEDDRNELQRRIEAILQYYKIARAELDGWFFCASPLLVKLAFLNGRVRTIGPLEHQIREAVARIKPDLIGLDPFVKLHALEENNSGDMDFVCSLLARLAIEFNLAVDIPHHVHKGLIAAGDADSGRGSSGIRDASRLVYTLTSMSDDEAAKFGVTDRTKFIRLDHGKVNIAAASLDATWFEIVGREIGNKSEEYPSGDTVQVLVPWKPKGPFADMANTDINQCLNHFENPPEGLRYSIQRNADRQAWLVVKKSYPHKTEDQCRQIITAWIESGLLYEQEFKSPKTRKNVRGLFVENSKRPGNGTCDE